VREPFVPLCIKLLQRMIPDVIHKQSVERANPEMIALQCHASEIFRERDGRRFILIGFVVINKHAVVGSQIQIRLVDDDPAIYPCIVGLPRPQMSLYGIAVVTE